MSAWLVKLARLEKNLHIPVPSIKQPSLLSYTDRPFFALRSVFLNILRDLALFHTYKLLQLLTMRNKFPLSLQSIRELSLFNAFVTQY